MIKLLLLEDDTLFAETLIDFLEDEEFDVTHVNNGQSALDTTFNTKFDLYLLDINTPFIDGLTLLDELRSASDQTPAIFLTSYSDKETLLLGFKKGCNDFLKKPFDLDELLVRINVHVNTTKEVNGFVIDRDRKTIFYKNEELKLSNKEYLLLELLVENINKNVTKEMIITSLWSANEDVSDGAIRVYINRLKSYFPQDLENIRGLGYRLNA
ncbi:MAG: response regulator [Helicobacteraceae bacterium]|nr:response regulator [Helicobacteraceae bacterium]